MITELNINRLLESSKRSDVRGYNIYTCGKHDIKRPTAGTYILEKWDEPAFGLHGTVAIGYELDKKNLIVPVFTVNDTELKFRVMRNRWTPAFMDTYYRAQPFGEYRKSGTIAIREKKCFTGDDTFISHVTIYNDGRNAVDIKCSLVIPFDSISEESYSVNAQIIPKCLRKDMTLTGFAVAKTNLGASVTLTVPPQGNVTFKYGFAFSPNSEENARNALNDALAISNPFLDAENRFNRWMAEHAPVFRTENSDLLKIYYYRFFVVKSAIHTPDEVIPDTDFNGQCVYESPFGTWFGGPVGLSVPLQIGEMKWMKDTTILRSHISNWCKNYGVIQGYIQYTPMAIWNLYLQTGDKTIVSEYYEAIKTYTLRYGMDGESCLPTTIGSWETGAEYQPSFYQYTEPKWDWRYDTQGARIGFHLTELYRVDECVMYAANLLACKNMATLLGAFDDVKDFSLRSETVIKQIRNIFWDDEKKFFFDVDTKSGKRCDEAYSYDGFMPMMFSIFGKEYHVVFDKLLKGERFDSGFALTSVGKDCPMYWFDNCIAGPTASSLEEPHEYSCSWNGPVWPFAVSLVLEALGDASYSDASLCAIFKRIFTEYTELHYDFGDRTTPCICEHYRPSDGNSFSPYTEYFHSEWINLLFSYYLGIRITEKGVSFNPITDEEFTVEDVVIKGEHYSFVQKNTEGNVSRHVSKR